MATLSHEEYQTKLSNKHPNIVAVEKYVETRVKIKHKCLVCNGEFIIRPNALMNHSLGCPYCNGQKVLVGFNDIQTTHPEIANLLVNEEDKTKYYYHTSTKLKFKCASCNKEYYTIPTYISSECCRFCRDGISVPEKFMLGFLNQTGIDYIYQLSNINFDWCKNYRYDFYFELNGKSYIIETNGEQHYNRRAAFLGNVSLEQQMAIDSDKKELALKYVDEYIVIDCRRSEMKYLEEGIINSKLSDIFDISKVSFRECQKNVLTSIKIKVCQDYNNGSTCEELRKKYKLSPSGVATYLKQGRDAGICFYDEKESKMRTLGKPIICLNNMEEFDCFKTAAEKYHMSPHSIKLSCDEHRILITPSGMDKWMYLKEYQSLDELPEYEIKSKKFVKLRCLNTGRVFYKLSEIKDWCGIGSISDIKQSIKRVNGTCGVHPETNERLRWELV